MARLLTLSVLAPLPVPLMVPFRAIVFAAEEELVGVGVVEVGVRLFRSWFLACARRCAWI